MKLGSALVLLILILVMAGYLLSDDLHVREDLYETSSENGHLRAQVARQQTEMETLRQQLHEAETQNAALKAQVDVLQNQPRGLPTLVSGVDVQTAWNQLNGLLHTHKLAAVFLGWAVLLVLMTAGVVALGLRKPRRRGYPYDD
ncbi:hypothetical protein [Levilinea saccharolytica]|uniref:Uncharacterized protein n=1 Tax=Levilinea saccharolytica TaxID=229921 RepID=A0A0M8JQ22_9CHLR|nr:hypothetical protein [Levilinea saccharolytica]KPL82221.1 hypothetical protein ADN01_08920 [Levilinea saccharolytica]GAP19467.1 hypothetical protein LSAC_03370 [Levilinea saccharolytica]